MWCVTGPSCTLQARLAEWDATFEAQYVRAQRRALVLRRQNSGTYASASPDHSETLTVAESMSLRQALAARRPLRPVFVPLQVRQRRGQARGARAR